MANKRNNVAISFTSDEVFERVRKENKFSMSYTIQDMVKRYLLIRDASLMELKGLFTPNEWMFFAESLNSTLVEGMFRYSKSAFLAHCEDSLSLEGNQFHVDMESIKTKVSTLRGANIDALYSRVEEFWDNPKREMNDWAQW